MTIILPLYFLYWHEVILLLLGLTIQPFFGLLKTGHWTQLCFLKTFIVISAVCE